MRVTATGAAGLGLLGVGAWLGDLTDVQVSPTAAGLWALFVLIPGCTALVVACMPEQVTADSIARVWAAGAADDLTRRRER